MARVKINTKGTVIQWDDISARTPCVLNIDDEDFDAFLSYLSSIGINDYDVIVGPTPVPPPPVIPDNISQLWSDLRQLAKDEFGDQYQFNQDGLRSTRVVGTFTDGQGTPDISNRRVWKTNNSSPTTITNFVGGLQDDIRFILFLDDNTTIKHNANINLFKGDDFTGEVGNVLMILRLGSKWYEVSDLTRPCFEAQVLSLVSNSPVQEGFEQLEILGEVNKYSFGFEWDFGGLTGCEGTDTLNPSCPTEGRAGEYTITLRAFNSCSEDIQTMPVIIECSLPIIVILTSNSPVDQFEDVLFEAAVENADSFEWDFGGLGPCTGGDTLVPICSGDVAGEFEVTFTAYNSCGEVSQTILVSVIGLGD